MAILPATAPLAVDICAHGARHDDGVDPGARPGAKRHLARRRLRPPWNHDRAVAYVEVVEFGLIRLRICGRTDPQAATHLRRRIPARGRARERPCGQRPATVPWRTACECNRRR